jgi:hypothetical protein
MNLRKEGCDKKINIPLSIEGIKEHFKNISTTTPHYFLRCIVILFEEVLKIDNVF